MLERLKTLLWPDQDPGPVGDDPAPLAAAMLLFEVAWADHEITDAERISVTDALQELFGLNSADAEALTERAMTAHQLETSVYPFTREVNTALTADEKVHLVQTLWRLALADQIIDKYEEHAIRRIAELLYIPHREFIRAKHRAQAQRD